MEENKTKLGVVLDSDPDPNAGPFDGDFKYVVARKGGVLGLYAADEDEFPYHGLVAERFGLNKVLGGGSMRFGPVGAVLYDFSGDYGGVPGEIIDMFSEPLIQKLKTIEGFQGELTVVNNSPDIECRPLEAYLK